MGIIYSLRDLLFYVNNWLAYEVAICVTYGKMMSAFPPASARLIKLWILCLNDLLDGDLCKHFFYFHSFSLFFWFQTWLISDAVFEAAITVKSMQVMTSQIRSHIEYLIQTHKMLVFILYSKLMRNVAALTGFNNDSWYSGLLFGPPCRVSYRTRDSKIMQEKNLDVNKVKFK